MNILALPLSILFIFTFSHTNAASVSHTCCSRVTESCFSPTPRRLSLPAAPVSRLSGRRRRRPLCPPYLHLLWPRPREQLGRLWELRTRPAVVREMGKPQQFVMQPGLAQCYWWECCWSDDVLSSGQCSIFTRCYIISNLFCLNSDFRRSTFNILVPKQLHIHVFAPFIVKICDSTAVKFKCLFTVNWWRTVTII